MPVFPVPYKVVGLDAYALSMTDLDKVFGDINTSYGDKILGYKVVYIKDKDMSRSVNYEADGVTVIGIKQPSEQAVSKVNIRYVETDAEKKARNTALLEFLSSQDMYRDIFDRPYAFDTEEADGAQIHPVHTGTFDICDVEEKAQSIALKTFFSDPFYDLIEASLFKDIMNAFSDLLITDFMDGYSANARGQIENLYVGDVQELLSDMVDAIKKSFGGSETEAKQDEYLARKGFCCPACGTDNTEHLNFEYENLDAVLGREACLDCKASWVDRYQLVGFTDLKK
jgi:hypothetical protein